jgi:hypothetical protein
MSRTVDGGDIDLLQKSGDGDGDDASKDSAAALLRYVRC